MHGSRLGSAVWFPVQPIVALPSPHLHLMISTSYVLKTTQTATSDEGCTEASPNLTA
jgi:hypothetical protein